MMHRVFVARSAVGDFLTLPQAHMSTYVNWMRRELEGSPARAGRRLRGSPDTFRVISQPGLAAVAFVIDRGRQEVVIVMVAPGNLALALKNAELTQRINELRLSSEVDSRRRVLLSDWKSFAMPPPS